MGGLCFEDPKLYLWKMEILFMKDRFEKDEDNIELVMEFLKHGCPTPFVSGGSDRDISPTSSKEMSWDGVCFCGVNWCKHLIDLKYIKYRAEENPAILGDITNFLEKGCSISTPTPPTLPPMIEGLT